ncbi:MAG: hypothetical protein FJ134_07145 [Deltaproteobacteria bacterium]|nr:hypothetical protein [Deltaproteobacteria bacterium]
MKKADDLQLFYARVIDRAAKVGFILLLATFAIYVSEILEPYVPLADLPRYWSQPAHWYLQAARIETGWAWLRELHHGDFLNFVPIAVLAGVTILGYLSVVGKFFRRKETVLGWIIIVQVLILILAASGILKTGGH